MVAVLFRLAVGAMFVLCGRWAYRNPTRLYPSALYANLNSPILVWPARIFAVLLVLVGSFSILSIATERIPSELVGTLVTLGAAALATWYLCRRFPRVSERREASAGPRQLLTSKGRRFVWITLALAAASTIAALAFVLLRR